MSTRVCAGKRGDFSNGTLKAVQVEDKLNVLVSCVDGQIYATSAKCTHYGAPLAKGVIDGKGCLTCPWHGAAFNVKTGDVEDAPALDALHTFPVSVEGDEVFVDVNVDQAKANNRSPKMARVTRHDKSDKVDVLILGGGPAGLNVAQALRENGHVGSISIVTAEPYLPIDRTKLSKALIDDPSKVTLRNGDWLDEHGIDVRLNVSAEALDPKAKSVTLSNGKRVQYDKLVCATGSVPKRLPVDGANLENVFVLRTISDTKAINAALGDDKSKNLVIVGTSWIGLEAAIATHERAHVQVVGMDEAPFEKILGKEVGNALKRAHEGKGIKFAMQAELSHFEPSKQDQSRVGSVHLKDGTTFQADAVLLAVGVGPQTGYLKDHVELQKDGSVKVDEEFRVEGLGGDVYAVGDIASYIDANTKERYRIEHWNVAANHGRSASLQLSGRKILTPAAVAHNLTSSPRPYDKVPFFWSAQGGQLRYAGTSEAPQWEDVIIKGDLGKLEFASFYTKGDRVVAAASMAKDPIVSHVSSLMRLGKMPSAAEIRDGLDPLSVKLL